jgi:hypothetical protein
MGERRRWRAHWIAAMALAVMGCSDGTQTTTTGSGGNTSSSATGTGGNGGNMAGSGGNGGNMAGSGGNGGNMAGSGGNGGTMAGTGGTGGSMAGSGGNGGSMAGTGGTGGTGGSMAGTGGSVAGTGGSMAGTGGSVAGTGGSMAGTGGGSSGCAGDMDCNDGFSCTVDTCVAGKCTNAPSSALCDNGMFCDGVEACNPAIGMPGTGCTLSSGSPCDDGILCTGDVCNEQFDGCSHSANNALCNDGASCNGIETCDLALGCKAGTPLNCDDGVLCTDDFCDVQSGECAHVKNDNKCSNGQFCDGIEVCDAVMGCKAGTAINCNDNITCTTDSCNEATDSCAHAPNNGMCDDGAYCNGVESCDPAVGCQAGDQIICNDNLSCTADTCSNVQKKCVFTANNAACDNGLVCDGVETCNPAGVGPSGCATGMGVVCQDEGIACTVDACTEPSGLCASTADNTKCPNGQLCIPGAGGCTAAQPCTTSAQCDDGNACNGAETCNVVCQAGQPITCSDGVACTIDSCNPQTGACIYTPNNAICDDGFACNGLEACNAQTGCTQGTSINCNDGIACTYDQCTEPGGTCAHYTQDFVCDDGKFCTGTEVCTLNGCQTGAAPVCNDSVACTSDICDPFLDACKGVPNNALCPCGQTCNAQQGGCGNFCQAATCQGKIYGCGDCLDNDGDCLADSADDQCLGPCDNTEESFYGGIPGQNNSPCKSDCYFDQDTGAGNDDCYWSHKCDPLSVAPTYPPEGSQCEYNPNSNIAGYNGTCATAFATQSAACLNYCGPLTPNGCDCFGCCALPGLSYTVWLGSENPAGTGSCNANTLNDPTMCKACTQVQACLNTCEVCEVCIGKPTLPPGCFEQVCPTGVQKCGQPGQSPCPSGFSCITGCCISNPQ